MGSTGWKRTAEEAAIVSWTDVDVLANATVTLAVAERPGAEPAPVEMDVKALVTRRNWMSQQKDWADGELRKLNDELLLLMNEADQSKVKLWDGLRIERRSGSSPAKIEPTKLLEAGVTLDQIQTATVPGHQYQYVMITKEKGAA